MRAGRRSRLIGATAAEQASPFAQGSTHARRWHSQHDRAAEAEGIVEPTVCRPLPVPLPTVNYRTMMECILLDRQLQGNMLRNLTKRIDFRARADLMLPRIG